jgi:glycosyltransferase domain-containing protein
VTSRLTVVMPLKGRHLFTLRFLWHANQARLPYRFLIADGEVHPELARLLEDSRKTFPELNVEYIRYPTDMDLTHFYAKMADVLQRVRTPYVKLADNDDFLAPAGLEYCMNFLDSHDDYVCCSGGIAGFSVRVPLRDFPEMMNGPFNKLTYRYSPRDRSIDLSSWSATDRVLAGLRNTWSYYAVFRTSVLTAMWKEIREMDPTSFQLGERFLAMQALTLGKARSSPSVFSYVRQYWTSLQAHWTSPQSATRKTFVHYLLRSRFTEDVANVLDRISRRLAELDGGDPAKIADRLRQPLEEWVGDQIRLDYGAYATLRRNLRTYTPWLVAWLKRRRRLAVLLERKNMFKQLRKDGAKPEYIAEFGRELAQIEEVLTGREFKDFLGQHMLKLQTPR